jgi:hypothetical protein
MEPAWPPCMPFIALPDHPLEAVGTPSLNLHVGSVSLTSPCCGAGALAERECTAGPETGNPLQAGAPTFLVEQDSVA